MSSDVLIKRSLFMPRTISRSAALGRFIGEMASTLYKSPIGKLSIIGDGSGMTGVRFPGRGSRAATEPGYEAELAVPLCQLEEYFSGKRRTFDLPLELTGTPFQQRVWAALREIPYGDTRSYGEIARAIGETGPEAARDAASAIARTPTPIVVPCHRVIGADGSLTGYGGGLRRKQALLDFEASGGGRRALEAARAHPQRELI